ncbi:electron transport protein sco1/senc [Paraburkholderia hospita]|uniref:Electron transport protein sco1/senc n=2 Tax=Paraburkholderia hospita TaxID=169430 RepID=A0ABN0F5Z7_9BURK|nr:SCO family protein [Paraburkholderia hospita]EIM94060.1 electron transport protein sco1/senc [Paraburkholderia hospita]OUL77891.1 SCO family protein [Paraburkholderia hospita]
MLSALVVACKQATPPTFRGVDLSSVPLSGSFQLRDANGYQRSSADFRGKIVLLMFGYTHCPDVCPTSLARAARIKSLLGKDGQKLQVLFVTVDPERDSPAILREYATAFDPTFVGMYGNAKQTAEAAKAFGAFYRKVPVGNSYTMEHSALDYVIDARGKVRLALRYEESAQDCADDLRRLL